MSFREKITECWKNFDSLNESTGCGPDGLWIHGHKVGINPDKPELGPLVGFCGPDEARKRLKEAFPRAYDEEVSGLPGTYVPVADL